MPERTQNFHSTIRIRQLIAQKIAQIKDSLHAQIHSRLRKNIPARATQQMISRIQSRSTAQVKAMTSSTGITDARGKRFVDHQSFTLKTWRSQNCIRSSSKTTSSLQGVCASTRSFFQKKQTKTKYSFSVQLDLKELTSAYLKVLQNLHHLGSTSARLRMLNSSWSIPTQCF